MSQLGLYKTIRITCRRPMKNAIARSMDEAEECIAAEPAQRLCTLYFTRSRPPIAKGVSRP